MKMYSEISNSHPSLTRGIVWCYECGNKQRVNSAYSLQNGWPKCCGYTMSIDSPEERQMFKEKEKEDNG